MSHPLSIVSENLGPAPTILLCGRIHELLVEARYLAHEHVQELLTALVTAAQLSSEISTGGDAYPPGIRDEARRTEIEITVRATTLELLARRMPEWCCQENAKRPPVRSA